MKKNKFIGFLIIVLGLFFAQSQESLGAFTFQTVCQPPLTSFSSGGSTFNISFPPGGGTTCDTIDDCPAFRVPDGATIYSIKVDMELTDPDSEIGTPYVWVPVSNANVIRQIDASNCNIIESYPTGANPSRTFVIPGGDVWVANRDSGNVTKLSPLTGNRPAGQVCGNGNCGTDETLYSCPEDCSGNICGPAGNQDCRKYRVVGSYAKGGGPRGITGDISGNIWVGNYTSSNVSKLDSATGAKLIDVAVGGGPYGAIGDPFGHIWISNRGTGTLQCINSATGTKTDVDTISLPYGIGMGKDGSIYLACYECGTVLKYDPVTGSCPNSMTPSATYNTGVATGTRGVAVDQNGYIWTANSGNNNLYVFTDPTTRFNVVPGGSDLIGVAIDFDGYGWAVSNGSGDVYKYSFDGASFNLKCSVNVSGNPYNYSDMTGLRTIPKTLTIGSGNVIPLSDTGTFEICSDPSAPPLCSDSSDCDSLFLPTSCGSPGGFCEIPLKIFSMQAGDYTLKNLEVVYAERLPVTTGGLVPCGRDWNDLSTPWNETQDCNMCHLVILVYSIINFLMGLVVLISVLALIVAGLIYVKTGGDSSLITAAKQNVNKILYGFVIVFVAWAIINLVMILLGFNDPIGDGSWKIFNCEIF